METVLPEQEDSHSDESPQSSRKASDRGDPGKKGLLQSYKDAQKLKEEEARWEAEKRRRNSLRKTRESGEHKKSSEKSQEEDSKEDSEMNNPPTIEIEPATPVSTRNANEEEEIENISKIKENGEEKEILRSLSIQSSLMSVEEQDGVESTGISEDEDAKTYDDSRTDVTEADNISDGESKRDQSESEPEKDKDSDVSDASEDSSDDDADIETLRLKLKKERAKGRETQEKLRSLILNINEYRKEVESEKSNQENTLKIYKKEIVDLQKKIEELNEEKEAVHQQYDDLVSEFDEKMKQIEEEKRLRNKENIDNLGTLLKEISYIEESNEKLGQELDAEKEAHAATKESLELQKQINQQLEVKIHKQKNELVQQELKRNISQETAPIIGDEQLKKQLQEEKTKLEKIGRLLNDIRSIAFPSLPSSSPGAPADHLIELQSEQDEHNKTKLVLEEIQKKSKEDKKTIEKLEQRVKQLIQSMNSQNTAVMSMGGDQQLQTSIQTQQPLKDTGRSISKAFASRNLLPTKDPKEDSKPIWQPAVHKQVDITKEKKTQRKSIEIQHPLNFENNTEILAYAVESGNVGLVQKILKGNKSLASFADSFAVLAENLNMTRLLLDNHADVNRWTALHYAVDSQSNNSELLKLLLKQPNARVDIPNADNNLPIHYFSKRSFFDQDVFSQLINKATNRLSVLNAQNKNGETPLHKFCIQPGHEIEVEILISEKADLNLKTLRGETALHYAARAGLINITSMLVHAGVDISVVSAYGTAFDVTQSAEIKSILSKAKDLKLAETPGKSRKQISVPVPSKEENTALKPEQISEITTKMRGYSISDNNFTVSVTAPALNIRITTVFTQSTPVDKALASIRKKFPGNTELFSLYIGNVRLEEDKIIADYPKVLELKELTFRASTAEEKKKWRSTVAYPNTPKKLSLTSSTGSSSSIAPRPLTPTPSTGSAPIPSLHQSDSSSSIGSSSSGSIASSSTSTPISSKSLKRSSIGSQMQMQIKQLFKGALELDAILQHMDVKKVTIMQSVVRKWLARRQYKLLITTLDRRSELAVTIFKTENAYLQSITSFVYNCIRPNQMKMDKSTKEATRDLFETFTNIQEITGKLVGALEERIKFWEPNARLAQVYLSQQASFAYYSDYVRYYYSLLPSLKNNKELVAPILKHSTIILELSSFIQNLTEPVSHSSVLKRMFEEFLKNTPGGHPDVKDVAEILSQLSKLNEEVRVLNMQLQNEEKIQQIENSFINSHPKLVAPGRFYIRDGDFKIVLGNNPAIKKRTLFLFNDCIVVAKRVKTSSKVTGMQYIETIDLTVDTNALEYVANAKKVKEGFSLLISTPKGPLLIYAKTEEERASWIRTLKSALDEFRMATNLPEIPDKLGGLLSRTASERKLIKKDKRTSFLDPQIPKEQQQHRLTISGSIAPRSIVRRTVTQESLLTLMGCSVCHTKLSKGKARCNICGNAVCKKCSKKQGNEKICLTCLFKKIKSSNRSMEMFDFPQVILYKIMSFVSMKDLRNLFTSCKQFYSLSREASLWKAVYSRNWKRLDWENDIPKLGWKQNHFTNEDKGSADQSIKVWDLAKMECSNTIKTNWVQKSLCLLGNSKLIASVNEASVKIFSTVNGKLVNTIKVHSADIVSLHYDPKKETLITASTDKSIKFLDIKNNFRVKSQLQIQSSLSITRVVTDDNVAAVVHAREVTFWDIKEQKLVETATFTANICGVWFDGSLLACALDDFTIRIYSMSTHFEVDVISTNEEVNLLQFDRNKLVSGGASVKVFSMKTKQLQTTLKTESKSGTVYCMQYNNYGLLVSGHSDGIVRVWKFLR